MDAPERVTVYTRLGEMHRECSLHTDHVLLLYGEKHLTLTDEVRVNQIKGGYSDTERENPVYRDAQGRLYDCHYSVDYYASTHYRRRDDGSSWTTAKMPNGHRYDKVEELLCRTP
jgi:hypothetical protein